MVFTRSRRRQIDRLVAVPGLVVVALALLTIRVTDVIGVLLLKLFIVNIVLFGELSFPESERLVEIEADALEEETQLQATEMLKMMLVLQCCVKCLHAGGHVSS